MDVGLNVKLTSTGGCVSCPNAGTAATMASKNRNSVLADLRTKLQFPHADMPEPPVKRAPCGITIAELYLDLIFSRWRRKSPEGGGDQYSRNSWLSQPQTYSASAVRITPHARLQRL